MKRLVLQRTTGIRELVRKIPLELDSLLQLLWADPSYPSRESVTFFLFSALPLLVEKILGKKK